MTSTTDPVWIKCSLDDCPNGIGVYWKHADNFDGRFVCPDHEPAYADEAGAWPGTPAATCGGTAGEGFAKSGGFRGFGDAAP